MNNPEYYEKLEDAIVTKLGSLNALDIDTRSAPESGSDYNKPFRKGLVTVGYFKSEFAPSDSQRALGGQVQDEKMIFEIMCESRSRRGPVGILRLIKYVQALLLGFRPEGSGRMYLTEQGYTEYDAAGQTWNYTLKMASDGKAIQDVEEEILPLLESITVNDNFGDETNIP